MIFGTWFWIFWSELMKVCNFGDGCGLGCSCCSSRILCWRNHSDDISKQEDDDDDYSGYGGTN